MKKFLVIFCAMLLGSGVYANDKFIDSLKNCSSYSETGTVNISGINAISRKQMNGWNGDKCTYIETVNFGGNDITTTCHFTRSQINEITSVADAYYLTQKYSGEKDDLSSIDSVKNNPVVRVLNKYLQDPAVCSMSGL